MNVSPTPMPLDSGGERYVYSEDSLWIDAGIPGNDQESSFMNATLQSTCEGLEFSVAVHVEVPTGAASTDQHVLRHYLAAIFQRVLEVAPELHVEIQLGPEGDGEGDG